MDTKKIKNISMIIGALSLLMIAISFTIHSISNKAVNDIVIKEYEKEQERIKSSLNSPNSVLRDSNLENVIKTEGESKQEIKNPLPR